MVAASIRDLLSGDYITNNALEWVDIRINSMNIMNITVVSDRFNGKTYDHRRSEVLSKISIIQPYEEGFLQLYTSEEAEDFNLSKPNISEFSEIDSWQQLSLNYKNNVKVDSNKSKKANDLPKVISFYSYKGGVGRTVALAHVAYILASRGKKVAIVDMDIEAPGMGYIFDPKTFQMPKFGLIDYLLDRVSKVKEMSNKIFITDIFSEIDLSELPGRLFVVPAGTMDVDYLGKVDQFKGNLISSGSNDYWEDFVNDLNNQVKPDIILVDSRTGLNHWGALSLLKIADNVIFFAYPNNENMNGLKVILKTMKQVGYNNYYIVFSRIHDDKSGKKKVEGLWDQIKQDIYSNEESDTDQLAIADPIMIYYSPELAVSDYYPVAAAYHTFSQIANIVDEEIEDGDLVNLLSGADRWEIIRSLPYENLGFGENDEDNAFFQKTVYVDKFLDEEVPIITGKKGTGKTKMYSMMLKYFDRVKSISRISLDNVTPISGHGSFSSRPIEEFDAWAKLVSSGACSWESIWKAYLLTILQKNTTGFHTQASKYKPLKDLLQLSRGHKLDWKIEDTNIVSKMSTDLMLAQLMQDYISNIDEVLLKKGEKLWILYDKLDEDLEMKPYGRDALEGLFKLVQIFEGKHIRNFKFKIFIRLDIWESLTFTNKSHFKGRTIKLEWKQQDFLKLALRISLGSEEFTKIISRYKPLPQDIDYMDLDALKESLQVLWGIRRDGSKRSKSVVNWIYERLTDSDGNTFPRSLFMLLKGAKDQELSYEHSERIQSPRDRLLRSASLNIGLKEASVERCDALGQEYPKFKGAFDLFSNLSDTFYYDDFFDIYNKTEWNPLELLDNLKKIGVISEKEEGKYIFSYIYIDGFNIRRTKKI